MEIQNVIRKDAPANHKARRRFDITIAGEINLDLILRGLPEQMPIDRELLATGFDAVLGSSSAILAHNLAMLGTQVGFITMVGRDGFGEMALERVRESGADLSAIRRCDTPTGVTVLLPHADTRHILTYPGAMTELTGAHLDRWYLADARHFHLSSLFLQTGLHPALPGLFDELKLAGLTLSLDTNDDPAGVWGEPLDALLDRIDVLLPNADEAMRMTGRGSLDEALDVLAERVPLIVVKCGVRGAVVQQGHDRQTVAAIAVQPVDTIGAGDSFNAGFLSAYVCGVSPVEAAALGVRAGALSTLRAGGTEAFRDAALRRQFLGA